jgi:tetratricopeptide (TPR) repeat protein
MKLGNLELCISALEKILAADPLNHLARYVYSRCGKLPTRDFYEGLHSDPCQTCLDIAFDLSNCGLDAEADDLLKGLSDPSPIVLYVRGEYVKAGSVELKSAFPFRLEEYAALQRAVAEKPRDAKAHYFLGCFLYSKGHYEEGAKCFQTSIGLDPTFYIAHRNLAVANYSHLNRPDLVLPQLATALKLKPGDGQLIFETAYVMGKYGIDPAQRIDFILKNSVGKMEENVCRELARAYDQNDEPQKAIDLYDAQMFVACEGGEHQLVEPYMFAYHLMGRKLLKQKDYAKALVAFQKAQVLPQNLGAGLWNEVKLVPHQYYEAQCLDALGKKAEAEKIYSHILCLTVDYFTNMHLKELPYYLAECHRRMGDELKGRMVMDKHLKLWKQAETVEDPGYFATTPFFISYCDNPARLRTANYRYLIGLARRYARDEANSRKDLSRSAELEPYNLYFRLESEM